MRKVTKILGKVLSAAVLLLIVLPLALSLLLSINAVQNFVVGRAAQFASRKLETVVRIDRVDIGIFDRITLEGLYVEDYGGDTLLYVGKLHAFITQFGIFSNGFTLRHGRLTDGKFYLREMPDGVMNVKQIVSRMGRKEKKKESDFRLSISALTVENLEFRLEKLQHRNPVYGIDFSDMDIRDIDAVIDNFTIDGGAVGAEIGRFSAREKSGFEIDDFGGKFFLANGCIGMENARLVTPHSNVSIPAVSIVGDSWAEYKEYVDRVSMTVEVRNSMLSSDDVAYFSPKLRDWRLTLRNINLLFDGVVSDFNADLKSLSFGRSSRVHARGRVTGLPKIDDTHFSLTFDDVTTEAADLGQIAANVARKELSAKMSAMMDRAGALRLTGEVEGTLASFDSKFALSAPVGSAEAELAMQPADRRRLRPVKGRIAVTGFRVGELLEQPNLGSVSCEAGLNGVVGKGLIDARVDGSVSQLEFNGYDYDSLRFGGRLTEKTFNGHVRADDPALRFDFQGEVGFNPERPHYDFDLDLIQADLARMHLNRRDSVSVLSALVEARASGRTLDDLNGKVTVGDVVYRYNADTLRTTRLTLDGQNSAGSKYLSLQSEFADATFRSRTDYKTVFEYLRSSLEKYIPLLYDERKARKRAAGAVSVVDDYSVLSVDVKHFTPVADAVADGLQIADGSQLRLLFNPANDKLSLKATSEYIERERMLATAESQCDEPRRFAVGLSAFGGFLRRDVSHAAAVGHGRCAQRPPADVGGIQRYDGPRLGSAGARSARRAVAPARPVGRRAAAAVAHQPQGDDVADLRPQHSDRYGAHSGRPVPGDEQGSGVAGRRRGFAPPARFGAAAVEEFRSRAVHPDRRKHGLCHRGAHERSGGGEIRARRYRDHGRHPNGQRRGERHPGAADAFHLDVGFQERPRAADGDRSGEA